MEYITASELRTKPKSLIKSLVEGSETRLVYKSRIVGIISPFRTNELKILGGSFIEFIKNASIGKVTAKRERDQIYKKHLMGKYARK